MKKTLSLSQQMDRELAVSVTERTAEFIYLMLSLRLLQSETMDFLRPHASRCIDALQSLEGGLTILLLEPECTGLSLEVFERRARLKSLQVIVRSAKKEITYYLRIKQQTLGNQLEIFTQPGKTNLQLVERYWVGKEMAVVC